MDMDKLITKFKIKGGITRCIKTENTLYLTINDLHI